MGIYRNIYLVGLPCPKGLAMTAGHATIIASPLGRGNPVLENNNEDKSINLFFGVLLIIILILLSSCGFQSVYKLSNEIPGVENENYKTELAAVDVKKERKYINQQLRNNLQDVLNPDKITVTPKYLLTVNLEKSLTSTFTTSIGSSGRNKVILNATYSLKSLESGDVIAIGNVTAQDDFDVQNKRFANYITQETIEINLTKIIAQNIRNSLIRDIAQKDMEKTNE